MDFLKSNIIELLEKADRNELVLPNFQRDFVWKPEQQKLLVASFLVNLPIGTFLMLDGEKEDFVSKKLCLKIQADPTDFCLYLLDGQQRLSTIKSVFSNLFEFHDWEDSWENIHYYLRNRWYLDLNEESCSECFGYSNLNFKIKHEVKRNSINVPILSIKEPNDILDSIKFYQIFKTKKESKFHPGRTFKENTSSKFDKELEIANLMAVDLHIPLFDFLSEDKNIIKYTLKTIANAKVESIKNRVLESEGYQMCEEILGHLDSSIHNKYKNGSWDEINKIWDRLRDNWVESIMDYFKDLFKSDLLIPHIKSNELSRATSVFEFMNKGGTPLDTFDIMVAKYAEVGSEKTLSDELENILISEFEIPEEVSNSENNIMISLENFGVFSNEVVSKSIKELFLNFISVCNYNEIKSIDVSSIKKDKILKLRKHEIEKALPLAAKALHRSLAFLQLRCGVINFNDISYNLMLLPIGMMLRNDEVWTNRFKLNKIEFWYWTTLFSGRFREKQNNRAISELKELSNWIEQNNNKNELINRKENLFKESNYCDEDTLFLKNEDKTVPTAIYKGLLQYVLSRSPNDFKREDYKLIPWMIIKNSISLNDHHIIPLASAKSLGDSAKALRADKQNLLNSPLNRTLITKQSNNEINSLSIDSYLPYLNANINHSHCLPDDTLTSNIAKDDHMKETYLRNRFYKIRTTILQELSSLL